MSHTHSRPVRAAPFTLSSSWFDIEAPLALSHIAIARWGKGVHGVASAVIDKLSDYTFSRGCGSETAIQPELNVLRHTIPV